MDLGLFPADAIQSGVPSVTRGSRRLRNWESSACGLETDADGGSRRVISCDQLVRKDIHMYDEEFKTCLLASRPRRRIELGDPRCTALRRLMLDEVEAWRSPVHLEQRGVSSRRVVPFS